jgi:tape measure domain-containing protein
MANEATILRIRAQVENLEGLNRARSAVRNFATESKAASNDLDKLRSLFKELGSESVRSVNNLKNYRAGLDALRQSAQIGSTTFNELTAEIKQLDIELGTLQGKQAQVASGFNKIASSANAAATATRRQFDLSGAGATFGRTTVAGQARTIRDTTQYAQPIGPRAVDYAAINTGLTQAVQAEQQLTELSRRARQERLLNAEKYNNLEIAAADKKAREELRIQQQGFDRAVADFDRRLANRGKRRANLQQLGQTAGAVAASGVFGGPEGLVGAGIGAIGGPGGALAGGAIGAQVGIIRQAIGATAEYAAQIDKLNIALKSVAGTSSEYANAQSVIATSAKALNIPVLDSTQSFTRLAASVRGAGGRISDAQIVFNGVASAIKATGGSAQDIQGAILAMSQTFSKGKVSAEELSGQLGERLPGAVTLFAEATGRTLPQLSKDLQEGAVGLNDLMKFAIALNEKYAASALAMAGSTEEAGARMQVATDEIKYSFGELFKPLGAQIQDAITGIATLANTWIKALQEMAKQNTAFISSPAFNILLSTLANGIVPGLGAAGGIVKNLADYGKGIRSPQQRLTAAGSTTMYSDESGNIYDTATGKLMFPGRSGVTTFANPERAPKSNKAAENAAKRLAERRKEQLADAKQLYELAEKGFELSTAMTEREKLDAEYNKTKVEIAGKYDKLLRDSLSKKETEYRIGARSFDLESAKQKYEINKLDILKKENRELYAQSGLLDVLSEKRQAALAGAFDGGTATGTFRTDIDLMPGLTGGKLGGKMEELKKILTDLQDPINQIIVGAEQIGTAFSESFTGLINGSMTAQESLGNFFRNIGNYFLDMASKMIAKYIEMQIIGLAQKFLPGMFGSQFGFTGNSNLGGAAFGAGFQTPAFSLNANGNVFAQNGIVPFANGGIVDRPMMFPFAKGIGLMGEAGPEAIMPLKRGADGKLGVAGGGGGTSVVVNVDASGSSVEGNQAQGRQLGVAVSAAVQAELVKQQRPGGLLAGTRR